MRTWIAIVLATPIVLGLVAWLGRPPVRTFDAPVATSHEIIEPESEESPSAGGLSVVEETVDRERENEKAVLRLEENFDIRIQQLIASIDWTRAESRVRYPIEYDMIQADFDRAVDAIYRNQPRSFSRE